MNEPRVLIVEDDQIWRKRLSKLLSNIGAIDSVSSFEMASQSIRDNHYDVIVMDLDLGEGTPPKSLDGLGLMDGINFLGSINQQQGKTIVISGYGTIENMRQAFKRGAYDFIQKQKFNKNEFLNIIKDATAGRETRQGSTPTQKLNAEEKKEYEKITKRFLRGNSIVFEVPENVINPWDKKK